MKTITEKTCTKCGRTLPISEFYKTKRCSGGLGSYFSRCKKCVAEYNKANLRQKVENTKKHIKRVKKKAYLILSKNGIPQCAICGFFGDIDFLQIDHIKDDGSKDLMKCGRRRTGYETYNKIIQMLPEEARLKYQLLCPIHNWAKRLGIDGRKYAVIRNC